MNIEYGPSEEFIEYVIKIQNDQVYQNEVFPAECFVDSYEEFENVELIRNENDPPIFSFKISMEKGYALRLRASELISHLNIIHSLGLRKK